MNNKMPESLSTANQIIHTQRSKISELESLVTLLENQVKEETRMRYVAWSRVAELTSKTAD